MIGLRGRKCNIEKKVNSDEQLVNGHSMEGEKTKREKLFWERFFFFFGGSLLCMRKTHFALMGLFSIHLHFSLVQRVFGKNLDIAS